MTGDTRRDFLRKSAKGGLFLGAQALGIDEIVRRIAPGPIYGTPAPEPRTVNMIEFLLPSQSYDDAKQFHTTGYMLYNFDGYPPRVDGGYMKMARVTRKPDEFKYDNEVARYIIQKSPRHPCEYSIVLQEDAVEDSSDEEHRPTPRSPIGLLAMAKEKKKGARLLSQDRSN